MRRSPWPWCVAGALLATLAVGCGGDAEQSAPLPSEAWHRIEDGWARAIALDPPLVLEGARAGDALEAVVLPSGPGDLVVESRAGVERVPVTGAGRIVVPLPKGGRVTVSFDGPPAAVHAPRIAAGDAAGGSGRGGDRPRAAPRRIALVVIDTLRADAVTPETMPELLDFFAGGTRYTRAYSPATWTLPAMAAILTGKPPTSLALSDGTLVALSTTERTIASDLAERGYRTVGISANYTVNHENAFSAGFGLFQAPALIDQGAWPDAAWVLDRARRALEWFPDRDLFLYLHLMEPHDPYVNYETGESLAAPSTGTAADAGAVERMRVAYASEARRVSVLLTAFLREAGPFERVVVTADHGEEFLEHGGFRHGPTVYPEVIRVPLLVLGEGIAGSEVDDPVSLIELRRFLTTEGASGLDAGDDVEAVAFVHAAPRFAWAHQAGQAVLFGRSLDEQFAATGSGAVSPPDPIIRAWLRAHHPAIDFVDPRGAPRAPLDGEALSAALRLARRFHGLRRGRWVLVPAGVERVRIELDGYGGGGWWWGVAKSVELAKPPAASEPGGGGPPAVLEVVAPDPFALAFVPGAHGRPPSIRAGEGALDQAPGPPGAAPVGRALTWEDTGRPAAMLQGVEETMRRLRTQGYL